MNRSPLFDNGQRGKIEASIVATLNAQSEFLSVRSLGSPRAVGDAVQEVLSEHFKAILGETCKDYSATFARRAMADLAFYDVSGFYYVVDVKTHNLGTQFNMPNLTSVERLARFYEDDNNYFTLLIVKYEVRETQIVFMEAHFVPIEFLSWECLTVGALGWGQIQISNANVIKINTRYSRKKWMLELCDRLARFYPREIDKIGRRMAYFESVRIQWEQKPDDAEHQDVTVEIVTPSADAFIVLPASEAVAPESGA